MNNKKTKQRLFVIGRQVVEASPGWVLCESDPVLQFSNVVTGGTVSVSSLELCHFLTEIGWRGPQRELDEFLKRSLEGLLLAYELVGCRATWFGSLSYRGAGPSIGTQSGLGANLGAHGESSQQKLTDYGRTAGRSSNGHGSSRTPRPATSNG